MNKDGNNTVLAVSHAGACADFLSAWQDPEPILKKHRIPNCGIFKYDFDTESQRSFLEDVIDPVHMEE